MKNAKSVLPTLSIWFDNKNNVLLYASVRCHTLKYKLKTKSLKSLHKPFYRIASLLEIDNNLSLRYLKKVET